jgi:DNA-binding MarR family transcriptional regulator
VSGAGDWRRALHDRAKQVWDGHGGAGIDAGEVPPAVRQALGSLAEDALQVVEAYARGARAAASSSAGEAEFTGRLDLILNGIAASLPTVSTAASSTAEAPHMIQSDLWQVLRKVRESAELSYSREQHLIELDRRLLFLLHSAGQLVPADIAGAVGVDKAQVSRSLKRLLELQLVERQQIRSPLRLTREGERLSKRLLRMADLRNRELTIGISDEELSEFFATIEILLDRAVALYEQERELAQDAGREARTELVYGEPTVSSGKTAERVIDRSRIISPLMTLSAYFSRSGALAFKRLTGLSTFEAFVLSEIGRMDPPIDWTVLVAALERDQSQAARTVNALVQRGLVGREGKPGRRHGRFYPSSEGTRLFQVIQEAGRQRSAFLLEPLAADQRRRFLATFDKVRRNAVAQLARERALAEINRG